MATVIAKEECEQYMLNWEKYVLSGVDNLYPLFSVPKPSYGFSVIFQEFQFLLCSIQSAVFKVRFGLDDRNQFQFIMWGEDDQKKVSSEYLCTTNEDLVTEPYASIVAQSTPVHNMLPPAIAQLWLSDWEKLIAASFIPVALFKVGTEVLRGHTFDYKDFVYIFTNTKFADLQNTAANFCFVNHQFDAKDNTKGTFGLTMIGRNAQNLNKSLMDGEDPIYVDMSRPCPNWC
jgi:hypothetical protein